MITKVLTLSLSILLCASAAYAQDEKTPAKEPGILPIPDYKGDFVERVYLTGDWGGSRTDLAKLGIQTSIQFVPYIQSIVNGGLEKKTKNGGKAYYYAYVDLERMGLIPGGLLSLKAESRYGRTVNRYTGSFIPVNTAGLVPVTNNNLNEDLPISISALNYTHFVNENFLVYFGKYDFLSANFNEFSSGSGISQFMNYNLSVGASVFYPNPYSLLAAGFAVVPNENLKIVNFILTTKDSSTTSGFDNLDDGLAWATEIYYQSKLGTMPYGAMGGVLYSFDNQFPRFMKSPKNDTWSLYFNGWNYFYLMEEAKAPLNITQGNQNLKGLGVFWKLQFSDKTTNPLYFYASAGIGGKGLIPSRGNDTFGIGYFYNKMNTNLVNITGITNAKQGAEAYYNIAFTNSITLKLDAQILDTPTTNNHNTVVIGAQFIVKL